MLFLRLRFSGREWLPGEARQRPVRHERLILRAIVSIAYESTERTLSFEAIRKLHPETVEEMIVEIGSTDEESEENHAKHPLPSWIRRESKGGFDGKPAVDPRRSAGFQARNPPTASSHAGRSHGRVMTSMMVRERTDLHRARNPELKTEVERDVEGARRVDPERESQEKEQR